MTILLETLVINCSYPSFARPSGRSCRKVMQGASPLRTAWCRYHSLLLYRSYDRRAHSDGSLTSPRSLLVFAAMHPETCRDKYEDRVIGCILGAICGDVLGASVENWNCGRVALKYPNGLTEFQRSGRGYGCYTDDSQMLLAVAASLVNNSCCAVSESTHQYVLAFDPDRGYGGSAVKILIRLSQGADPAQTGTQFLPGGSYGNGGAMRIAPVGLAYRNAHLDALEQAVQAALLCTHVHPLGVEGALTQALAVANLSKMDCTPRQQQQQQQQEPQPLQLLQLLKQQLTGRSEEMCDKLAVLEEAYQQVPHFKTSSESWRSYLTGPGWSAELATSGQVAPGFQIKATDAVAAALWAAVLHWDDPVDAVVAAVHYGGDTDTIACMTGALMGALHGTAWVPSSWLDNLENKNSPAFFNMPAVEAVLAGTTANSNTTAAGDGVQQDLVRTTRDMGREAAVTLAKLLARLDCRQ